MRMKVKKVRANAILPKYQTKHAAGMDFYAAIDRPIVIEPMKPAIIPTGIAVVIPVGYELQVRCRSGLAFKHNIGMMHGLGTIDADFRDEMKVLLFNYGDKDYVVEPGERIAQAVVAKHETVEWQVIDELDETDRQGGFGSTGK